MRGLYAIADAGSDRNPALLARAFVQAGCRIVQVRCKGWAPGDIEAVARECLAFTRPAGALLVVNDHAEIAARVGADGVHVGQADRHAAEVREIVGPDVLIGISNNTPDELASSLPHADYVAVGPMYATPNLSRPKPVRGLALLREARARTALPLVAIGGITVERVPEVRAAGADAWAVIRGVCEADDPAAAIRAFLTA
ncbi:MAG: thiamine phosphate synthase [Alphaproteobacteria bacterium]|nr:thiamine phosphate synthase [Alphaproteobacteria bacterium]